jgi:hypothetical protein
VHRQGDNNLIFLLTLALIVLCALRVEPYIYVTPRTQNSLAAQLTHGAHAELSAASNQQGCDRRRPAAASFCWGGQF